MKYYLIVGEASGDLHASRLMRALKQEDSQAEFRFYGGDLMAAEGGEMVMHYRHLAYMGFVPVLLHLPEILSNMRRCKRDILTWKPDAVILVDYPGFNLKIARYVKSHSAIPVYYYIAPKIWAWKEYRIKQIKRDVDELFSILPFEVAFFEGKHGFPIHYVGNPTADEVHEFLTKPREASLSPTGKPIIALLAGSRRQEIKDNLPAMIEAAAPFADRYELVAAGAPGIEKSYYQQFTNNTTEKNGQHVPVSVVFGQTYPLLSEATAALVTSGTATLETALFGVPQVVCYKTPLPHLISFLRRHLLKVPFISLVNLIAGKEVVPELVADTFSVAHIRQQLTAILPGGNKRQEMTEGYNELKQAIGKTGAPHQAARLMTGLLKPSEQAS